MRKPLAINILESWVEELCYPALLLFRNDTFSPLHAEARWQFSEWIAQKLGSRLNKQLVQLGPNGEIHVRKVLHDEWEIKCKKWTLLMNLRGCCRASSLLQHKTPAVKLLQMFRDYAILPNEFPEVLPNPSFSPFPVRHYNWSDTGGNDSMWLSFGVQRVYCNAVLQPVTDFCFFISGKTGGAVSAGPPALHRFSLRLLAAVTALPTVLLHFLRKTKKDKRQSVHGEQIVVIQRIQIENLSIWM